MNYIETYVVILAIWNTAVFTLYGMDKYKARRGAQRISEKALLFTAALMGAPGALAGMYTFRHKTKHKKFVIGVPLLLIADIAIVLAVIYYLI